MLIFMFIANSIWLNTASAKALPQIIWPGIIKVEEGLEGLEIISEGVDKREHFVKIGDIPLKIFKDRPEKVKHLRRLSCVSPSPQFRCIMEGGFDGENEYWLFYKDGPDAESKTIKIPVPAVGTANFFSRGRAWFTKDAPLAYYSHDGKANWEMVVEFPGNPGGFIKKTLTAGEFGTPRPVTGSKNIKAVFVIRATDSPHQDASKPSAEILTSDGLFKRHSLPVGCRLIGAINDQLLCLPAAAIDNDIQQKNNEITIVNITAPENFVTDYYSDLVEGNAHSAVKNYAILPALRGGVFRPYAYDTASKATFPILNDASEACLADMTHVRVAGVTAKEDGILINTTGPFTPRTLQIVPFNGTPINYCEVKKRVVHDEDSQFDSQGYVIHRSAEPNAKLPPYIVVKGKENGPLSGRLLIFSYGSYGTTQAENYFGAWGKHWLENGGSIAIAHLPGGGGYGEDWVKKGRGLAGKATAAHYLDRLADHLISAGYGKYGSVSLYSASAGGVISGYASLLDSEKYESVILRAACFDINLNSKENCIENNYYGDPKNPVDRELSKEFQLSDRVNKLEKSPLYIFGLPEFDQTVNLQYQRDYASKLTIDRRRYAHLKGAHHTDRLPPLEEEKWVLNVIKLLVEYSK